MTIDPTYLGYLAALCTTSSFIPQAMQALKTRDTHSISLGMYTLFEIGVILWLIYGLLVTDVPLIIANIITVCLTTTILALKVKNTLSGKDARMLADNAE